MKTKILNKKNIVGVFAFLMALTLSLATVFGLTPVSTADAASGDVGQWISVKEIYNDKTQSFDHDNLLDLFEALTGEKSFNAVKTAARSIKTSMDFRALNDGSNIVVKFGGLLWDAVYLTTTSDDGDVILDLWRSSEGLWGYWGVTESNKATFSSDGWGVKKDERSKGTDRYPANMYSTSLIRVDKLNAGGNIAINKDEAKYHEQDSTNQYARFTMEGDENGLVNGKPSLTEYIATPAHVAYQKDEWNEATAEPLLYFYKFYAANEAYGTPREGGKWHSDSDYSLQDNLREENEKYDAWQNDYLWLPSYSETGDDNKNRDSKYGIWETDKSLLSNPSSYAWLRSAEGGTTYTVVGLDGSGGWNDETVSQTNWVRPAMHLNLTKAAATTLFEDTYAIEYDVNGGIGNIPKEYHMTDERIALATGDGIERPGCVFLGWSERNNSGAIIDSLKAETAARVITSLTLTREQAEALPDRTKTLYALWAEDKNGNGIADYRETGTTIPELNVVVFGDMVVEYDGEPHKLQIDGDLPAGFNVRYEGDNGYNSAIGATEPGIYTVTAIFTDDSGTEVARKTATLTITKKKYDLSGVAFEDKTLPYDGAQHSLSVEGLPDGVSVTYFYSDTHEYSSATGATEPGVYTVTATFTVDEKHYEVPASMKAVLTITKATYDMAGVMFADKTFKYDGAPHSLSVEGLPDGVSVTYFYSDTHEYSSATGATEPGLYTVTATFTVDEKHYEVPASMKAVLTITKATYDMAGVMFTDKTFKYDGAPHSLAVEGELPAGVRVTYFGNGRTDIGVYEVLATFTIDDSAHYEVPAAMTATLTIEDSGRGLKGITFEDGIAIYDGNEHSIFIKGTPADGISVTYTNNRQTEPGVYSVTATFYDSAGEFAKMTATLTILKASLDLKDGNGNTTLIVDGEDGFDPTLELAIESADNITRTAWAWEKDALSEKFTIKFMKDGAEVPLDGKVTVRLLIPEEWRDKDFTLQSVGRAAQIEYTRDGDYVIFEADGLSAYTFTMDGVAYLPILLAAAAISLLCMGTLIVLAVVIKKNKKGDK